MRLIRSEEILLVMFDDLIQLSVIILHQVLALRVNAFQVFEVLQNRLIIRVIRGTLFFDLLKD